MQSMQSEYTTMPNNNNNTHSAVNSKSTAAAAPLMATPSHQPKKTVTVRRHDPYATSVPFVATPCDDSSLETSCNFASNPKQQATTIADEYHLQPSALPSAVQPLSTFPAFVQESSFADDAADEQPSSFDLTHMSCLTSPMPPAAPMLNRSNHQYHQQQTPPPAPKDTSRVFVCAPSRPGVVLAVPRERVLHVPAKPADNSRLTLCPAFDVADPSGARCEAGSACGFVHADVRGAEVQVAHERVASWRSLADVPYPRHEAGLTVEVRQPPACGGGVDRVASESLLMTRALANTNNGNTRLRHCVHFVTKGICHRGSECSFAHVVDLPALPAAPVTATVHDTALPPFAPMMSKDVSVVMGGDSDDIQPVDASATPDRSLPLQNNTTPDAFYDDGHKDFEFLSVDYRNATPSSGVVVTSRGWTRNPYAAVPRTVAAHLPSQPSVYRTW